MSRAASGEGTVYECRTQGDDAIKDISTYVKGLVELTARRTCSPQRSAPYALINTYRVVCTCSETSHSATSISLAHYEYYSVSGGELNKLQQKENIYMTGKVLPNLLVKRKRRGFRAGSCL